MALTEQQKTEFLAVLGVWNGGASVSDTIEFAADNGDDIANRSDIVTTHETLADFTQSRGRPQEAETVHGGRTPHVGRDVQFRKRQPRRTLFLLEFDGVSASMVL
jgi:hypothetical protein